MSKNNHIYYSYQNEVANFLNQEDKKREVIVDFTEEDEYIFEQDYKIEEEKPKEKVNVEYIPEFCDEYDSCESYPTSDVDNSSDYYFDYNESHYDEFSGEYDDSESGSLSDYYYYHDDDWDGDY